MTIARPRTASVPRWSLLLAGLVACAPEGFEDVDHRVFYGAWSVLESADVPEGTREGAIRVQGSQADGRDATFVRVDRTLHGADSLTPGCTGELWRRGSALATTPEVRGPDPRDPRFPEGRTAEVGAIAFTVDEAIVRAATATTPPTRWISRPRPGWSRRSTRTPSPSPTAAPPTRPGGSAVHARSWFGSGTATSGPIWTGRRTDPPGGFLGMPQSDPPSNTTRAFAPGAPVTTS